MKKIIHLMSTNAFSGAENVACQIINGFRNDKEISMIYVSEIKSNKKSLDERNIEYYEIKKFNLFNLRNAINDIKPNIIHAHDVKASILATFFCKKAKIISHIHANHENMRKLNIKTFLYNFVSKKFSKIIWISQSAFECYYYKNRVEDKSDVIYNTISVTDLKEKVIEDKNQYKYDLIFLGRLVSQKNPIRFINLIKKVVQYRNNLKVAMVGDGELYNTCKEYIEKLGLHCNIDMYGFVNNPYKILECSKIMVMTSKYEGTPMSALEAIALEKPIVSTPTDGLCEVVKDGKTGFLNNDDNILVEKICYLLDNEEEYKRMAKNVKSLSEKINDINVYKKKILKNYLSNVDSEE